MRLDGLQRGVAQHHAGRRLLAPTRSALWSGSRGSSCRASSPPSFGGIGAAAESHQNTLGDFQFIELVNQLCPLGINPCQPLGNPLLFLSNLVQPRHLFYPSSSPIACAHAIAPTFSDKWIISASEKSPQAGNYYCLMAGRSEF